MRRAEPWTTKHRVPESIPAGLGLATTMWTASGSQDGLDEEGRLRQAEMWPLFYTPCRLAKNLGGVGGVFARLRYLEWRQWYVLSNCAGPLQIRHPKVERKMTDWRFEDDGDRLYLGIKRGTRHLSKAAACCVACGGEMPDDSS